MTTETNVHGNLYKSIGRTLQLRRESCGLNQDQVSMAIGIGKEAVSRMERGITMPTVQRLAELADLYKCGIDELLIESSTRTNDQAELISKIMNTLPDADRAMIVEVVQRIAERLKHHL